MDGAEFNWWAYATPNITKTTLEALAALGKPLTYIGWEVGFKLPIGKELTQKLGRKHPTTEAYFMSRKVDPKATELPAGNPAYHEAALFYTVEGGVGEYFNLVRGRVQLNEKGGNTWVADEKGNEAYVTIIFGQEPKLRKIRGQGHAALPPGGFELDLQRYDAAREYVQAAISISPATWLYHYLLGLVERSANRLTDRQGELGNGGQTTVD